MEMVGDDEEEEEAAKAGEGAAAEEEAEPEAARDSCSGRASLKNGRYCWAK
jgi:hypothetical protein